MCLTPDVKIPDPPAPPPPPDVSAEMKKPKKIKRKKPAAAKSRGFALRIPRAGEASVKTSGGDGSGLRP